MKKVGLQGFNLGREIENVKEEAVKAKAKMNARVHSTVKVYAEICGKPLIFTTTDERTEKLKSTIENTLHGIVKKIVKRDENNDDPNKH